MTNREQIIREYMGKSVHVIVDRPIGYRHGDILYSVNYGHLPGVTAGDGEEQDVYILGIDHPLDQFDGQVIGAICRSDDVEDKLVAAPAGTELHQGQIMEAVRFQEQYFTCSVESLFRKSCGVIPYRIRGRRREYLLLMQTNSSWSFPKGHMEAFESEEQTALRELREETGLTAELDTRLRCVSEYRLSSLVRKQVVLFPGKVRGNVVPDPNEVRQYRWVAFRELGQYLHPDTLAAAKETLAMLERM